MPRQSVKVVSGSLPARARQPSRPFIKGRDEFFAFVPQNGTPEADFP